MAEPTKAMQAFRSTKKTFPADVVTQVEKLIKVFEQADNSKEYIAACAPNSVRERAT